MSDEISTVESAPTGNAAINQPGPGGRTRSIAVEDIDDSSGMPVAIERGKVGAVHEDVIDTRQGNRLMPEHLQKLMDKIDAGDFSSGDTVEEVPTDSAAPPAEANPTPPAPSPAVAAPTPDGDPAATPEPAVAEDPLATERAAWQTERDRIAAANTALLAEVEQARTAKRGEPSARDKALDEVETGYLDDSVGALRKLIGTVLGAPPDSKDVDAELSLLYADLTARELQVQLPSEHRIAREAARARQMLARDKRERAQDAQAKQKESAPDNEAQQTAKATARIDGLLTVKQGDKAIADEYPLLIAFSQHLDGMKPSEVLWKDIEHGIRIGAYDPAQADDVLIRIAAKKIETHYQNHYQALADAFGKARPQPTPSTAPPAPSTAPASPAAPQSHGRRVTNAIASVAPATPPAKTPTTPAQQQPPKFKSEKERRDFILAKHGMS